ncbi:MAG: hypothetical protein CL840_19860 [Crocinitomicaceae bacterium]|nr:hypothetical protein [Crocinitomicaceae bacterium]
MNHQEFVEAVKADSGLLCSQQLLLSPHIKVDSISTLKFDNKPVLVGDTSMNSNCPSAFINIDSRNKNRIEVYVMVTTAFDYVSGGCSFYRRVEYQAEVKVKKAYWRIKYGEVRRSSGNIRWL